MTKYRRKQQTVEAVRFDPKALPWPGYITRWSSAIPPELNHMGWLSIAEGKIPVSPGDWVVTEGDDRTVWDDATFKRFYVEVEEL